MARRTDRRPLPGWTPVRWRSHGVPGGAVCDQKVNGPGDWAEVAVQFTVMRPKITSFSDLASRTSPAATVPLSAAAGRVAVRSFFHPGAVRTGRAEVPASPRQCLLRFLLVDLLRGAARMRHGGIPGAPEGASLRTCARCGGRDHARLRLGPR